MMKPLTEPAINVIRLAQQESRQQGHGFVGTGQLLLGTIGVEDSIAARALKSMGVTLDRARIEVEKIIGRGSLELDPSEIPFSPNACRALELIEAESQQLGHKYSSTEHILLATIRVEDGNALKVLANLGVDSAEVRDLVIRMLSKSTEVIEEPLDIFLDDYGEVLKKLRSIDSSESREIVKIVYPALFDNLLKEWENSDRSEM